MRTPPRASAPLPAIGLLVACLFVGALALVPATHAATPQLRVVRDVRVPTTDGKSVTVDLWRARAGRPAARASRRARPIALLVHGGGWHTGDKRQWERSRWAQRLAKRGWLVVNANYRLSCTTRVSGSEARGTGERDPRLCGHAMRTSISDVRATLRYTARQGRAWGGDPRRIVLFGASAGGHLAMLAGSDPARPAGVRAVVAIGPPTDLSWVGSRPQLPLYWSAHRSIGCALQDCPGAWRSASPRAMARRRVTPPTWVFTAGADPITPIAPVRAYVRRLSRLGVRTTLLTTADPTAGCHGPIECQSEPLRGTQRDMFGHALAWIAPFVR